MTGMRRLIVQYRCSVFEYISSEHLTSQSVCHRQLAKRSTYMFKSGQNMKHSLTDYHVFLSIWLSTFAGMFREHFISHVTSSMNYFPRPKIAV